MQENVVEYKNCKHCNSSFEITDKDLEFYEKISPIFGGKKYLIPSPTFCPDCRNIRRMSFRNERKLYRRKCDMTGKDIISIYSPDKNIIVYNRNDWWSEKWNPIDCGKDYDFGKVFFEQFKNLMSEIPFQNSFITLDSENSDYGNHSGKLKNCYLLSASWENQNCLYSSRILFSNNSIDILEGTNLENCYENISSEKCYKCFYIVNSDNCSNSYFLFNCKNCENCFGCSNLTNKKNYIFNKEYSIQEYEEKIEELKKSTLCKGWSPINKIIENSIIKNLNVINCENCFGDNLLDCKESLYCFNCNNLENSKYLDFSFKGKYIYDGYGVGENLDLGYEILDSGLNCIVNCFLAVCHNCNNTFYSFNCYNSSNLFGCIGLRNKSYCILNKQYSKEEYEIIIPKIIEHMMKTQEWGEFFPSSISPFGYNETVAQEYFPLNKEKAIKNGFNWSDFEAPFPKVDKIIKASMLPSDISKIPDDILNWAIECEVTGKPFRIVGAELEFYRKYHLSIPKRHPDQRYLDRLQLRNQRVLFDRKCDKCGKEIKTTYSPDRKEIVYCENCYEKEVY